MKNAVSSFLFISLLALLLSPFPVHGGNMKQLRIAVLDFSAPKGKEWMGVAVAESLRVKFTAVDGIEQVERAKIQAIMKSKSEATPALLGVDWLIQGTVQVVGESCRISLHPVAARSGVIRGEAACVVDGRADDLFSLETAAMTKLAAAMGLDIGAESFEYQYPNP